MTNQDLPENLLYNRDFSWVKIDGQTATLGITKPAADKVKEFVFIKLPKEGQAVKRGESYTSLEALKWSGHISSPLSGKIIEVHEKLFDNPSIINQDPYGEGWIAKLKIDNQDEVEKLLDSDQAAEWVNEGMPEEMKKNE